MLPSALSSRESAAVLADRALMSGRAHAELKAPVGSPQADSCAKLAKKDLGQVQEEDDLKR